MPSMVGNALGRAEAYMPARCLALVPGWQGHVPQAVLRTTKV
jgi:hypothetical protein